MALEVVQLFKRRFGHAPTWTLRVPTPITLLGAATESNEGLALTVALNRFLYLAATPRTDGTIQLLSSAFPDPANLKSNQPKAPAPGHWSTPVVGVLLELQ